MGAHTFISTRNLMENLKIKKGNLKEEIKGDLKPEDCRLNMFIRADSKTNREI